MEATVRKCQECGSPLEGKVSKSGLLTCAYCGAGYDLRAGASTGPALIARADFSGPTLSGWRFGSSMEGRLEGHWSITQVNDGQNHPLLVAPGVYDDFDVRVRFRFREAASQDCVFLRARGAPGGAMSLHLDYDGVVTLRWQMPDHQWQDRLACVQPAHPAEPKDWRELRWVARGQRHLAYLNGVLVISTQHRQILHSGYLDLRIQTTSPSVSLEVSELSLWEAG